ncbi:MAG: nucleotide exchange factor GrpE [Planctomycetes bacterium]|nr:nucleotide exchange factor GrpE [Planctomycetota bacterium]
MMKKKIVIPTPQEVAQYTGGDGSGAKPADEKESAAAAAGEPRQAGGMPAPEEEASGAAASEAPSSPAEPARSEAEEFKDKYLRAVAELANYRKRSQKDYEESLRYANAGLIRSLLGVLDNLERVMTAAQEHPENTAVLVDGVKLTSEDFRKVLRDYNVSVIEAEGQPFDPALHEAMMQQPSDQYPVPTVLKVVREGYRLHDRLIRPARVIVSTPPAPTGAEEEKSA